MLLVRDKKVYGIACGGIHNAVYTTTGQVYTWGCADDGALGRFVAVKSVLLYIHTYIHMQVFHYFFHHRVGEEFSPMLVQVSSYSIYIAYIYIHIYIHTDQL